jgi:hypothetical protein
MFVPILRRTKPSSRAATTESTDATVEEVVEISETPIRRAGGVAGGIAGVVSAGLLTALVQLFTFFAIDQPKARQSRELENDKAQITALERALSVETAAGRKTSVQLLLATGVLTPEDRGLLDTLLKGGELPAWTTSRPNTPAGTSTSVRGTTTDTTAAVRR